MSSNLNKVVSSDSKTRSKVTCNICKKYVNIKNTALCSICKKRYEFDCVGYPEATYRLKDVEERKKWKCNICIKNKKDADVATSNITLRKKQRSSTKPLLEQPMIAIQHSPPTPEIIKANISTENSFESLLVDEDIDILSHTLERNPELYRSCPNLKSNNFDLIEELEKKVTMLAKNLEIAENEIANLLSENCNLKKQMSMYGSQINQLKDICKSTPKRPAMKKRSKEPIQTKLDFSAQSVTPKTQCLQTSDEVQSLQESRVTNNYITNQILVDSPNKELHGHLKRDFQLKTHTKSNIYIIGDEKVRGLAAQLIHTKTGKWNDNYNIEGKVLPHASSCEILRNPVGALRNLSDNDIVILSVGKHDKNPYLLLTNLCRSLCSLSNCTIFIMNVTENRFLNVKKLNHELKLFTKNFKNCKFIEVNQLDIDYHKKLSELELMTFKVNIEIDFIQYEKMTKQALAARKPLNGNIKNTKSFFRG